MPLKKGRSPLPICIIEGESYAARPRVLGKIIYSKHTHFLVENLKKIGVLFENFTFFFKKNSTGSLPLIRALNWGFGNFIQLDDKLRHHVPDHCPPLERRVVCSTLKFSGTDHGMVRSC